MRSSPAERLNLQRAMEEASSASFSMESLGVWRGHVHRQQAERWDSCMSFLGKHGGPLKDRHFIFVIGVAGTAAVANDDALLAICPTMRSAPEARQQMFKPVNCPNAHDNPPIEQSSQSSQYFQLLSITTTHQDERRDSLIEALYGPEARNVSIFPLTPPISLHTEA